MCKLGDIIVVNKYIGENGKHIGSHSFIVIDDNEDIIRGIEYTHIATVISSFKSKEQKRKKLNYKGNIEIKEYTKRGKRRAFNKSSYVKADKLFYFNKNKLDYYVLGRVSDDLLEEIKQIIIELANENKLTQVISNL